MSDKTITNEATNKPSVNTDNLRFLTTEQIDSMLNYHISQHQDTFDFYFMLVNIRNSNKVVAKPQEEKPVTSQEVVKDDKS